MPGIGRVPVGLLVRDSRERDTHVAVDGVGRQEGLGVHGIHVVDAVEVAGLGAVRPERPNDDVEDDGPPKAAHVDGPGRRLRIVDDLRSAVRRRKFIRPVHGAYCAGRRTVAGGGGASPTGS